MCPNFKRISRKTFLFSLSPLALSLALALNPYSIEAQANTYEYNGKWVADDIDPTNPPFLQGSIVTKDSSGTTLSEEDFTYSEPIPGFILSPYGFREGQDWSFLWLGSSFEDWYNNPVNKPMADRYGITATNTVTPNSMNLSSSLLGGSGSTTVIHVPAEFEGASQRNSLFVVLPTSGPGLITQPGSYKIEPEILQIGYGADPNQEPTLTNTLISLGTPGTQTVEFSKLGWNDTVFNTFKTDTSQTYQPHQNVLFMKTAIRSPGTNAVARQTVSGNIGIVSTADDHVPGSVTLFKEDGWHIDAANIKMAGNLTFPRVPHNTNGISAYGMGMSNMYSRFEQKFSGIIQSLGTDIHPLGIGIISEHDQATAGKTFIQDIKKVNEIHAVMAGVVNDIRGQTFNATESQEVDVGKIEVFGDASFRGAIGVYNRTNTGGTNNSKNAVQKIYISDSIVVDGFSTIISPHQYLEVLSTFAAVTNRGGRQEIISTNRDSPILLSAKTQMRASNNSANPYGTYALLVYPNFVSSPAPGAKDAYTETILKGSFDVYNGDIAAFGEQNGHFSSSVGIRLEGQLYPAADGSPEKVSNRLSIADGNNIIVTDRSPLIKGSIPSTIKSPNAVRAYLQLRPVTDSNGVEHPYEIEFKGKNSYLNVEGAYLGNGTIIFHSNLDFKGDDKWTSREEFMKENGGKYLTEYQQKLIDRWKSASDDEKVELAKLGDFKKDAQGQDYVVLNEAGSNAYSISVEKAYKELFDQGNNLVVNKNPVIIHKVIAQETNGESSRLNLQIDTSNLRRDLDAAYPGVNFASEQPKIQKFFDENAIYILRQAANNVFIHDWSDEQVLLPHQTVLNEKTGQSGDGRYTQITDDHDSFWEKINPEKSTGGTTTEKKNYTLSDGTLVETTITTQRINTTNNRFTGNPVNNMVAGKVFFTLPEGIITPARTYVTEYYIENKGNYDINNPYGYNDNEILHTFLAEYQRNKYGQEFNSSLDIDSTNLADSEPLKNADQLRKEQATTDSPSTYSLPRAADEEEKKEGNKVEDDGIENMGEVYGKVETYITTVDEKVTPPEDDCTKYGNCAPEDPDDDPNNGNPGSWEDVTPPTKPDGSIDVGNGCSTSTMDALDSIGLTNYFLWRQENETLYQRMGEVRDNSQLEGLWVRGIFGRNKWDKGKRRFDNKYYGIQLGLDRVHQTYTDEYKCRELDGERAPCKRVPATDWIYGIGFTYMKGDSKLANGGTGDNWIGSISLYGVRKFQNGGYLDLILKGSRLNNEFTAISDQFRYISKGKYHTYALQASVEYGNKHYLDKAKTWYVDPELQLTYGHIKGVKYRTFNALNVDVHNLNSLIGRAGVAIGKEGKNGSAFLKVDGLREFMGEYKAQYHLDHGAWNKSRISMKDTWGEITIGGTYNFHKDTYGFIQAKKSFAADLKQEYRVDMGIRYLF